MVIELGTTQLEPYVGPVPFEAKDEAVFFGREGESDELLSLAIAHPVVLMYAQSGAGKTSLLNANFVPKLKKESYEVLPIARVQGNDCDAGTNIYVFNTLMNWAEGKVDPRQLARMTLVDFLRTLVHQKNNVEWELPRFLIFDQFEELFTAYPQRWQERKEFFMQIRDALEKDYLLRVVFAMREDYIAELDAYAELLPEKLRTRFRLERPRAKAALSAVTKPLEVVHTRRHFADGVAEQLVQNLLMIPADTSDGEPRLGQFVEPVQLQVVCQSLWKALGPQDEVITYQHLENCGDVNRALSDFYERCINRAVRQTGVKEGELRDWFGNTLITSDNTRGMVFRGPQKTGLILNSAVDVLEKLHLIKEEKRGRSRWYELAHDRFIEPIRKSNEKWLGARAGAVETRRRLEARAAEWVRRGRGSEGLLNETELLEAERWRTSPDASDLSPSEALLALISASRAAIREQAEAIRQGQLLAAEQQRRLRQFRLGLVVAAVLLIVMSGLTVFAYRQTAAARDAERLATERKEQAERSETAAQNARAEAFGQRSEALFQRDAAEKAGNDAIEQKKLAEAARTEAERAQADAEHARADAIAQKIEAVKQRNIAEANELATKANSQLKTDPELSVLLAREAVKKTYDSDRTVPKAAEEALHAAIQALRDKKTLLLGNDPALVRSPAFTPDGTRLAGISSDGTIKIWDIVSLKLLHTLSGATKPALPLAFSADGKTLASSSSDRTVLLWDVEMETLLDQTSAVSKLSVTNLAFSKTKLVALRSDLRTTRKAEVFLWDVNARKFNPVNLPGDVSSDQPVNTVAIDPNGKVLAFGRDKGSILLWDLDTAKPFPKSNSIQMDQSLTVTLVAFDSKGERFAAASADGSVKVWDLKSGRESFRSCSQTLGEKPLAFSPDLEYVVTASTGNTATVRRLRQPYQHEESKTAVKPQELTLVGHNGPILSAAFSAYGKTLITASADETAIVWEVSSGHEVATLSGPWIDEIAGIAFSPDGKRLATAIADVSHPTVEIWADRNNVLTLSGHKSKVWAVAFNRAGTLLASGSSDRTAAIWDAVSGKELRSLSGKDGHHGPVRDVSFSPDGNLLATASDDGTAKVWDIASGKVLRTLYGHKGGVYGVAFSPDGRYVATASLDQTAKIWDLRSCKDSASCNAVNLEGHSDKVFKVAFSPDGTRVATASQDKTAKVWDVATGQELVTLKGHSEMLWGVSFSPDGTRITTASTDMTARIWDLTGRELLVLTGHSGDVNRAVFSPDGMRLATSSQDGTVRLYTLNIKELIELSKQRVPRELTAEERKEYLPEP
jgi:WD40 repeat protein